MKQRLKLFSAFFVLLMTLGIFAGTAYAAGNNQVVQGSADHSVYKVGSTVLITGTINGDVYCAGQTITIDATVNGDVLCAGQAVTVSGKVNGSIRLVGETVNLSATVMNNASIAGQSVVIEHAAQVGEDASFAGQTVTVDGAVGRDLTGAGSQVMLNGSVGRNVTLRVNDLTLGSTTNVTGNMSYTGPHRLQQNGNAQVHGAIAYHKAATTHNRSGISSFIWFKLYWLIAMVILGVVLVALFPGLFRRWNPGWGAEFWWDLLIGFVASLVVPLIALLLLFTVLGAPIGILLLLLWIAAALLAMPLAAYFTGELIMPNIHPVIVVLIGGIILGVIQLVPVLGWIVGLLAYWTGSGILLRGLARHYTKPTYESVGR